MKKTMLFVLSAMLFAMVGWSCSNDDDNDNQSKVPEYFGLGKDMVLYSPVELADLPDFLQNEISNPKRLIAEVYNGIWDGKSAYIVYTEETGLYSRLPVGRLYLADGTDLDILFVDEVSENDFKDWTCVYYWHKDLD